VTANPSRPRLPSPATLRSLISQRIEQMAVPGAIVLLQTADETWAEAFGTREIGVDDPVTTDDHVRIGSNTKTMTGTALLQLVDARRIALVDPVSKYRPDVRNGEHIHVGQLLDMRSGLKSYTELESFNQAMDDAPARAWESEELLAIGLAAPVSFDPGTGWAYSNTNTVLAGLIVEQLAERPLEDVFAERIFEPLGLHDTVMPAITDASIPDPHPHGYMFGTNVSTLPPGGTILPDEQQRAARDGTLRPGDYTGLNPSWCWAAGAAIATVGDLATYVEALVGGGLISDELQQQRLDSVVPVDGHDAQSAGYGLALARFGPMFGHDGSMPGFQSFMGHDPASATTLVIATTLQFGPAGEETANELAKAIIGQLQEQARD
jgi:D-alanyl-D-alanine carboxypeptidase